MCADSFQWFDKGNPDAQHCFNKEAKHRLEDSFRLWREWGALKKVDSLDAEVQSLAIWHNTTHVLALLDVFWVFLGPPRAAADAENAQTSSNV